MENQHRKIKGYRELSQTEIDLMNKIKEQGQVLESLIAEVKEHHLTQRMISGKDADERERLNDAEPERWAALGRTHFQEGLMALTRSVAQPTFF